jgi:8-oxo-dGTP pyrophosphatase MutT (NUDIX family)
LEYIPFEAHGHPISSDRYFTLMAGDDDIGFIHCGDGVLVVPLDGAGDVLLAVERSAAFDRELLVLVGGSVEPGEPLEETANRELQEELGWRAEQIVFLGEVRPFKYLTSRQFVFLARGLTPSKLDGDELYPIATRKILLDRFVSLCFSGELLDAPSIAGLCLALEFLRDKARVGLSAQL